MTPDMAELIVKYPDRAAEHFQISRLRITIGRSARNDLCIPDPFASRVHAEVRSEGDEYFLQDLGSAKLVDSRGARFTLLVGYAFCLLSFVIMLLLWKENISFSKYQYSSGRKSIRTLKRAGLYSE